MNAQQGTFKCPVCRGRHPFLPGSNDFICPNTANGRKRAKARDVPKLNLITQNSWNQIISTEEDRYDERYIEDTAQYAIKPVRKDTEDLP